MDFHESTRCISILFCANKHDKIEKNCVILENISLLSNAKDVTHKSHNKVNLTSREDLKGCTLYNSKPLEYQTKSDYVQEGTICRLYIIAGIDCGV